MIDVIHKISNTIGFKSIVCKVSISSIHLISVDTRCNWSGTSVAETWGCCTASNPCGLNGGDCDNDNDCLGNLRCGLNNCRAVGGPQFHPVADCCII